MSLKLVASTKVFQNIGSLDMPMWKCVDGKEYIVGYFDEEPTWKEAGEVINKFIHYLEGNLSIDTKEIYSGFDLYEKGKMTHCEFFQLDSSGVIDFPAKDLTEIDVTDVLNGLQGI